MLSNEAREILELPEKSDLNEPELKKAYKRLSKKFHPDKWANKSNDQIQYATEKFKQISMAYQTLLASLSGNHSNKYVYLDPMQVFNQIHKHAYDNENPKDNEALFWYGMFMHSGTNKDKYKLGILCESIIFGQNENKIGFASDLSNITFNTTDELRKKLKYIPIVEPNSLTIVSAILPDDTKEIKNVLIETIQNTPQIEKVDYPENMFNQQEVMRIESHIYPKEEALKEFLKNSNEFAKMKELARESSVTNTHLSEQFQHMVDEINNARTFSDILKVTERYDFENSKDPSIQMLGATGANSVLYIGSFFSNNTCFEYYAATLRSNAIKAMAKYNDTVNPQNTITDSCKEMRKLQ
ncbi:MAG: hypothetical protein A3F14_05550 [Gammaproteobacteria bacterium RIFCSPHIGHO2_12_FULL_43_28]|nr:MAG: hypothetical protein A3F14_05550 [Gammaproteobacteria bacterium RIFCSPHIGHO2_12_FULL_43_28]